MFGKIREKVLLVLSILFLLVVSGCGEIEAEKALRLKKHAEILKIVRTLKPGDLVEVQRPAAPTSEIVVLIKVLVNTVDAYESFWLHRDSGHSLYSDSAIKDYFVRAIPQDDLKWKESVLKFFSQ